MPGAVLCSLHTLSHSSYRSPYEIGIRIPFTDEQSKAQRDEMTCPKSRGWYVAGQEPEPKHRCGHHTSAAGSLTGTTANTDTERVVCQLRQQVLIYGGRCTAPSPTPLLFSQEMELPFLGVLFWARPSPPLPSLQLLGAGGSPLAQAGSYLWPC